ncbi:terminase small subunit [Brevibacillus centrosporus]|uniref:terminase small subunit n=1 Tax=Brevibacillus centrosporus TaxID=54910 RepID=UPI002E251717|nr:terminase small subunit [Brevibacillus centrosporus]
MAAGRPLKFQSVEELQQKIDAFFEECKENGEPFTITGLALALDTSRRTLLDYEERDDEFSHAIKKAKLRVENFVEKSLWAPKIATGVIFNLKNNFGWVDKQEIDQNLNANVNHSYEDQIKKLIDDE